MNLRSDYVWLNGKLIPYDDALIHVNTGSLHYGYGVFEGIRAYQTDQGPAVFRLRDHIKRFLNSAKILGLQDFPYTVDEIITATHQVINENGFQACYIRPLLYFTDSLGLNLDHAKPQVSITTWEWGDYLGEGSLENGIHMCVSSITRHHMNVNFTKGKITGNYANSIMAKTDAARNGFDEAIMLDPEGHVAECTGENLFLVKDGVIYTPPKAAILEGITRDSLIILAGDLGYKVLEETISRDQLYIADEVFACGTAAELTPVTQIDHRVIGDGTMGPVTNRIQDLFFKTVRGEGKRSSDWLEYVKLAAPEKIT